jgi:xanthine dehydrogenase accessory factor
MTCPIGIPGIKGKEPATIAIAVAAELLQVREQAMAALTSEATAGEVQA